MSLFPKPEPSLFGDHDKYIRDCVQAFYDRSSSANQAWQAEAIKDARFEAGDQAVWEYEYGTDKMMRMRHGHGHFVFNYIQRIINGIDGHQRRNRKSIVVVPVENASNKTADQLTKALMWAQDRDNILEKISEAFRGALITGLNLLHIWLDFRGDPISGNIRVDVCDFTEFMIDPFFKKTDLSDCEAIWKRSFVTKREAASLLPGKEDAIAQLDPGMPNNRQEFPFAPENYSTNYHAHHLLAYDEYYYRDYRTQKIVVDTERGESQEWVGDDDSLQEFLDMYPELTVLKNEVPTVRLAIMVQGHVMFDAPNPLGIDEFPFVPVTIYHRPQLPQPEMRFQGVVRGLRDPQYLFNRRKVISLDILESQLTSGWKIKDGSLVDEEQRFNTGQGGAIFVKADASMDDAQQIPPPQIPQSNFQVEQDLQQDISNISCANEELMGTDDTQVGLLSMLRQSASAKSLQPLFDQLELSQYILGRRLIQVIQNNFAPGKMEKILQEQPTDEIYNKSFAIYDAKVVQGINTATQRNMEFAQLLQLKDYGIEIPDEHIIEAATVQNKERLMEALKEQREQRQQREQEQQQLNMQQQQATIEATQAQAKEFTGRGVERMSRVQENQALAGERQAREAAERAQAQERVSEIRENRAQAQEDRYSGLLDMAKALKEIEGSDIDNTRKLIESVMRLRELEQYRPDDMSQQQLPRSTQQSNLSSLIDMMR